jgi:hypothetical protein
MYRLLWRTASGPARWAETNGRDELVEAVRQAWSEDEVLHGEFRLTGPVGPPVSTTAAAIARWSGEVTPDPLLVCRWDLEEELQEVRSSALRRLHACIARAASTGALGHRQGASLLTIAQQAMCGLGPAGCEPDLSRVDPARVERKKAN